MEGLIHSIKESGFIRIGYRFIWNLDTTDDRETDIYRNIMLLITNYARTLEQN